MHLYQNIFHAHISTFNAIKKIEKKSISQNSHGQLSIQTRLNILFDICKIAINIRARPPVRSRFSISRTERARGRQLRAHQFPAPLRFAGVKRARERSHLPTWPGHSIHHRVDGTLSSAQESTPVSNVRTCVCVCMCELWVRG